jgi:hypothetical protein
MRHDQCGMALALRENREYNGHEVVIERPDGSCFTALAHANPLRDESGKLHGAVNVLGIGIPSEMLTGIFELFSQVDRSLERRQGGLGIGLNLVKRLVDCTAARSRLGARVSARGRIRDPPTGSQ